MNNKFHKILHLEREKVKKGFEMSPNFAKIAKVQSNKNFSSFVKRLSNKNGKKKQEQQISQNSTLGKRNDQEGLQ